MKRINRWIFLVLIIIVALLFVRGRKTQESPVKNEPAKVESIPGSNFKRVTLTAKAASRLGIQTVPVREKKVASSGRVQKVIPYASVIYGLHGETWIYINPEPLVFVRNSITVDYIDADLAVLTEGPPPETLVVTVGVAELYGTETGVGK